MSLTIKEVRVPTPLVRARKILAALSGNGDISEYSTHNAEIALTDGVAFVVPDAAQVVAVADTDYGLADSAIPGDTIRIEMTRSNAASDVVVTPDTFADGATITFDAVGEYAVLIWVTTNGWTVKVATATVA